MATHFDDARHFRRGSVQIHASAVVDPAAELGRDVAIGPFAVVESGVSIGDRTRVHASAIVASGTDIGADCEVYPGAVLGAPAQIRGAGSPGGTLAIGQSTIIREHVTIHRASEPGRTTTIGRDVFLLVGCHVAHDCVIGNGVTIANGSLLAGCVQADDGAFVSGNVVVHQFVNIGTVSLIGGHARVTKDVPPFMVVEGRSRVRGVNVVGMRRAGLPSERRRLVRRAHAVLYRSGLNVSQAVARLVELPQTPEVSTLLDFIRTSTRGICPGTVPRRTT